MEEKRLEEMGSGSVSVYLPLRFGGKACLKNLAKFALDVRDLEDDGYPTWKDGK